jgi:hypothetical protein
MSSIQLGFIAADESEAEIKWAQENGLRFIEYNYHLDFDDSFPGHSELELYLRQHLVHACAIGCWGQEFIS